MQPDVINGLFETGGAAFQILNVCAILRDRKLNGVHWAPTVFFTLWGLWNLAYYPYLDQWFSFSGGVALVVVNVAWVLCLFFFWLRGDSR